jgi:hypothetical protein
MEILKQVQDDSNAIFLLVKVFFAIAICNR